MAILLYAGNDRAKEARAAARRLGIKPDWRSPKYWTSPELVVSGRPVSAVYVLAGSPREREIVDAYVASGVQVEVVGRGGGVSKPTPPPPAPKPEEPWPVGMKMLPDQYLERFPKGPNADLARAHVAYLAAHPRDELWRG